MTTVTYKISDLPVGERPVTRLREAGPQAVSNAELLACILQTDMALQQANTLLADLGGLEGLSRVEGCVLRQVTGLSPAQASRLQAAVELGRRVALEPRRALIQVRAPTHAADVLIPLIGDAEQEYFVVLYLDTRNHIIDKEILYKGTLNCSMVRTSEVFRGAVRRNCAAIIVAHNHPSGDPSPSPEDITLTNQLMAAGKLMEIAVLDHLVIGHHKFVSLREQGLVA